MPKKAEEHYLLVTSFAFLQADTAIYTMTAVYGVVEKPSRRKRRQAGRLQSNLMKSLEYPQVREYMPLKESPLPPQPYWHPYPSFSHTLLISPTTYHEMASAYSEHLSMQQLLNDSQYFATKINTDHKQSK